MIHMRQPKRLLKPMQQQRLKLTSLQQRHQVGSRSTEGLRLASANDSAATTNEIAQPQCHAK